MSGSANKNLVVKTAVRGSVFTRQFGSYIFQQIKEKIVQFVVKAWNLVHMYIMQVQANLALQIRPWGGRGSQF